MKKFSITALFAAFIFAAGSLPAATPGIPMPFHYFLFGEPLSFAKTTIDLGEVPQGKPVSVDFVYKNNSGRTIIIATVQTSCGCTVADYEKQPIEPGKSGKIKGSYNAAALGVFNKTITVRLDDNTQQELIMKGKVI